MKVNPDLKKDDRIVLLHMDGSPSHDLGTVGIVRDNGQIVMRIKQYEVEWQNVDNGKYWNLVDDGDKWVFESDYNEFIENKRKGKLGETYHKRNIYKKTKI